MTKVEMPKDKGGSVEERLYEKSSLYSKFEFSFSVTQKIQSKPIYEHVTKESTKKFDLS
jgi:hypothetical protein